MNNIQVFLFVSFFYMKIGHSTEKRRTKHVCTYMRRWSRIINGKFLYFPPYTMDHWTSMSCTSPDRKKRHRNLHGYSEDHPHHTILRPTYSGWKLKWNVQICIIKIITWHNCYEKECVWLYINNSKRSWKQSLCS